MKKVFAIFVVGILLVAVWPVAGQIDDLVLFVTQVADNLMNQDTAIFEGYSKVIMTMDMGEMSQNIEMEQDITGEYEFDESDFKAWYTMFDHTISMEFPGAGIMEFDMQTESLMAEETLYERYTSDSPMFANAFPSGWYILDEAEEPVSGAGGMAGAGAMGDPTAMMPGIDITKLPYLIDEETVVTVEELAPEVIDGREMRVFFVELNMDAVSEQMSGWMSGMAPDEMDSEDAELAAEMMPGLFSELTMEWTVWIDTAAELPYRSAGTMVGPLTVGQQGMDVIMEMELEFDMTFTDFNVPVTIEPPELGT